jgi:hypothetical protein
MGGRLQHCLGWLLLALAAGGSSPPALAQDMSSAAGEAAASGESGTSEGGSGGDEGPSGSDSTVGYIDPAIPMNVLRFRYDDAHDNNNPSRGEFYFARYRPFGPGLDEVQHKINYQEISAYLERTFGERFSVFVEVPVRLAHYDENVRMGGLSDVNTGFKYAFLRDADTVGTFQLRTYIPSGNPLEGLGTGHVSMEPAFLLFRRFGERLASESELRLWVPIGGRAGFESQVVRYGTGLRYNLYQTAQFIMAPVVELVGWTFLDGQSNPLLPSGVPVLLSAAGNTIINVKTGLRLRFNNSADLYAGYGRPLTGDVLYKEVARVEFRLFY